MVGSSFYADQPCPYHYLLIISNFPPGLVHPGVPNAIMTSSHSETTPVSRQTPRFPRLKSRWSCVLSTRTNRPRSKRCSYDSVPSVLSCPLPVKREDNGLEKVLTDSQLLEHCCAMESEIRRATEKRSMCNQTLRNFYR